MHYQVPSMAEATDTLEETTATAGAAANTFMIPVSDVQVGMTLLLEDRPCKVTEVFRTDVSNYRAQVARIIGFDIFTGKAAAYLSPDMFNVMAPLVHTSSRLLVDVQDGFCFLMDDNGDTREDLKLPSTKCADPTLSANIQKALDDGKEVYVTITKVLDEEAITSFKLGSDSP
jgi:translation initiation factor 5A